MINPLFELSTTNHVTLTLNRTIHIISHKVEHTRLRSIFSVVEHQRHEFCQSAVDNHRLRIPNRAQSYIKIIRTIIHLG